MSTLDQCWSDIDNTDQFYSDDISDDDMKSSNRIVSINNPNRLQAYTSLI